MSRVVLWRKGIGYVNNLLKWVNTKLSENGPDTNCRKESSKATYFARLAFSVVAFMAMCYVVAFMAMCYTERARAGTSGSVNFTYGNGYAWAKLVYNGTTAYISTPNYSSSVSLPCAGVNSIITCANKATLSVPSTSYYAQVLTTKITGYTLAQKSVTDATVTGDNTNVSQRVTLVPASCAQYDIDSSQTTNDAYSGTVTVTGSGSAGTGILLRGIEYLGSTPGGPSGESDLMNNGSVLFDILVVGPFTFDPNCGLKIPFTTQTGVSNFWFLMDGEAKSAPVPISCADVNFTCNSPSLAYPVPTVNDPCLVMTNFTYSVPATSLPTNGTPTAVTVTAFFDNGVQAQCTFTATSTVALTFDGFYPPIGGYSTEPVDCTSPSLVTLVSSKKSIPIKFDVQCGGVTFGGGPTPTITIKYCTNAVPTTVLTGFFIKDTSSVWHFNWDISKVALGKYIIEAKIQDGTIKRAVVQVGK